MLNSHSKLTCSPFKSEYTACTVVQTMFSSTNMSSQQPPTAFIINARSACGSALRAAARTEAYSCVRLCHDYLCSEAKGQSVHAAQALGTHTRFLERAWPAWMCLQVRLSSLHVVRVDQHWGPQPRQRLAGISGSAMTICNQAKGKCWWMLHSHWTLIC